MKVKVLMLCLFMTFVFTSWGNSAPLIDGWWNDNLNAYQQYYWNDDGDGDGQRPIAYKWSCNLIGPGSLGIVPGHDCNDTDPDVYYGNTEVCDGKDNDCDYEIDEGLSGVTEICNGVDDNCDGTVDEGCNQTPWYADVDNDTYGDVNDMVMAETQPAGYVADDTDCNDNDALINPASVDDDCDGVDENCDSVADEGWVDYATNCGTGECATAGVMGCSMGAPVDTCVPLTAPEDPEVTCNDSLDNDCDTFVDAADSDCITCTNKSLWGTLSASGTEPGVAVSNGYKFTVDYAVNAIGAKFWKSSAMAAGTRTAHLWQGSTLLAMKDFSNETSSGWQETMFDSPIALSAGVTYKISYHTSVGNFIQLNGQMPEYNAPINASIGVYYYTSAANFQCSPQPCTPTSNPYNEYNANFGVDVIVEDCN